VKICNIENKKRVSIFKVCLLYLQFLLFANQIKKEKHLLPQKPFDLMKQYLQGLSVIVVNKGMIVAHVTLWELEENWYEVGTIWVNNDYRKHGLGRKIMKQVLSDNVEKKILGTSTNSVMQVICVECKMDNLSFNDLPPNIHIATCICDKSKTGSNDPLKCIIKDNKCQLFVK